MHLTNKVTNIRRKFVLTRNDRLGRLSLPEVEEHCSSVLFLQSTDLEPLCKVDNLKNLADLSCSSESWVLAINIVLSSL